MAARDRAAATVSFAGVFYDIENRKNIRGVAGPAQLGPPSVQPHTPAMLRVRHVCAAALTRSVASRATARRAPALKKITKTTAGGNAPAVSTTASSGAIGAVGAPAHATPAPPAPPASAPTDDAASDRDTERTPLTTAVELPCALIRLLRCMSVEQYRTLFARVCELTLPEQQRTLTSATMRQVRESVRHTLLALIVELQTQPHRLVGLHSTSAVTAAVATSPVAAQTVQITLGAMSMRDLAAHVRTHAPNWFEEYELACKCLKSRQVVRTRGAGCG